MDDERTAVTNAEATQESTPATCACGCGQPVTPGKTWAVGHHRRGHPEDRTLVALTPADIGPAQRELLEWCDRKAVAVRGELEEAETNLALAVEAGIKHANFSTAVTRQARRVTFYEKLKAAVGAGYLIVPNMPVNLFAVRVSRAKQPQKTSDSKWGGFPAVPQLLQAGEGRYVDEQVRYVDESHVEVVDGKERLVKRYVTDDYEEVDFPVTLVKPAILEATQRAMALRLFDQLGIVTATSTGDPIVLGQLVDPRLAARGSRARVVSFFVAWWLDTASL